jgi:hypothetical protein
MLFLVSWLDRIEDKLGARLDRLDAKLDTHIDWHTKADAR